MRAMCINDKPYYNVLEGAIYDVIDVDSDDNIYIINEDGESWFPYPRKHFEIIDEPERNVGEDETYAIYYDSDEVFCKWFTCFRCGNSSIREESNYCPNCGKKIIKF